MAIDVSSPRSRTLRLRVAQLLEVDETGDRASRIVDVALMALIVLNIAAITLETDPGIASRFAAELRAFEVFSVAVFTVEYLARLWSCVDLEGADASRPSLTRIRYALRPLILVDLLAIVPFYLAFIVPFDLRFLRLLRLFRVLKLTRYSVAVTTLQDVVRSEAPILLSSAFLLFLMTIFASMGIYFIESEAQPEVFGSIPAAMWWTTITITTVGYGDVTPITPLGKVFGGLISLIGIGMLALPTAILAAGFASSLRRRREIDEQRLTAALEDGGLNDGEAAALRLLRSELGMANSGLASIYETDPESQRRHCPHCGKDIHATPESRQLGTAQP
jgi:voltage-gated potassium channel